MDKTFLKELFVNFEQSQKNRSEKYFDFFKSITTLSVGLIGLLIGLKAEPIPNPFAQFAFLIAIILIGLCILFSLAVRFYELVSGNDEIGVRKKHILEYIENPSVNNFLGEQLDKPKIYKFFEISTFVCLLLSIIALIFYVYFLEFYPSEIIVKLSNLK